eukprot:c22337_g2_i1 orf=2-202(-)
MVRGRGREEWKELTGRANVGDGAWEEEEAVRRRQLSVSRPCPSLRSSRSHTTTTIKTKQTQKHLQKR